MARARWSSDSASENRGRVRCDVEVEHATSLVGEDEKYKENLIPDGRDDEEVDGDEAGISRGGVFGRDSSPLSATYARGLGTWLPKEDCFLTILCF